MPGAKRLTTDCPAGAAPRSEAEKRRAETCEALRLGMDDKLLMGGNDRALKLLREAYAKATRPSRLHWPLPEVAAYRLAYVSMRSARTTTELRKVHALLEDARVGATLDPLQHALEVAVCERLGASEGTKADEWRTRSREAFWRLAEAASSGIPIPEGRPVQAAVFNVVELCAFLLGEDYEGLLGRAALFLAPFPADDRAGFVLVGTHGVDHGVVMDRRFAFGEFEARLTAGEADIAFVYEDVPTLRLPRKTRAPGPAGRYLPHMCVGAKLPDEEPNNLNKSLSMLREKVLEAPRLRGLGGSVIEKDGDLCAFHPTVRVLGIVARSRMPELLGPRETVSRK